MFVLVCRKHPGWCGKWWNFGPQEWFQRAKHEKDCKGKVIGYGATA